MIAILCVLMRLVPTSVTPLCAMMDSPVASLCHLIISISMRGCVLVVLIPQLLFGLACDCAQCVED